MNTRWGEKRLRNWHNPLFSTVLCSSLAIIVHFAGCGPGDDVSVMPDLGHCEKLSDTDCHDDWKIKCVMGEGELKWLYIDHCVNGCSGGICQNPSGGDDECIGEGTTTCTDKTLKYCSRGDGYMKLVTVTECSIACELGSCTDDCVPSCVNSECGDDGCGGSCGQCGTGIPCIDGRCRNCVPQCGDKVCGPDGCGGSCGSCGSGECNGLLFSTSSSCQNGRCVDGDVILDCDDKDHCTTDSCDPDTGCVNQKIPGWVCKGTSRACSELGYLTGMAPCLDNCGGWDLSDCRGSLCGNGVLDAGEFCDPALPNSDVELPQCVTQGMGRYGSAACNKYCTEYAIIRCTPIVETCGNGYTESPEICDGQVKSCVEFGYDGGVAICSNDCSGWDKSACCKDSNAGCGNKTIDPGEICDSNRTQCSTVLFVKGTALCRSDCKGYDTSACAGPSCGNGIIEASEVCDPPGPVSCQDFGDESPGEAICSLDCMNLDLTACNASKVLCGNGRVDPDETCDDSFLSSPNLTLPELALYHFRCEDAGYPSRDWVPCLTDCSDWDFSVCGCSDEELAHACDDMECGTGACGVDCGYCDTSLGLGCSAGRCVCQNQCSEDECANFADIIKCSTTEAGCRVISKRKSCTEARGLEYPVCDDNKCKCEKGLVIHEPCGINGTQKYVCNEVSGELEPQGTCSNQYGICNIGSSRCAGNDVEYCSATGLEWVFHKDCSVRTCEWAANPAWPDTCSETGYRHALSCSGGECYEISGDPSSWAGCVVDESPLDTQIATRDTDGKPCQDEGTCIDGICVNKCGGGFVCGYGNCISETLVCDYRFDCPDGTDELGCGDCLGTGFRCPDGTCVEDFRFCAGESFVCWSGMSINNCLICDGEEDCPDGDDEGDFCD